MPTTMAAPSVPSGLRRSICTQTSRYHGSVRGRRRASSAIDGAEAGATVAIYRYRIRGSRKA